MSSLSARNELVDRLRGFALVLLVLEAARQYFHTAAYSFDPIDAARTTLPIFLTRWVTFLAAPTFALIAGVSIHLRRVAGANNKALSLYLLKRGLLLMVLEVTVVAIGRDFALPPPILFAALGTLGVAFVAMAAFIWLPRRLVLALGVATLLVTDALSHIHLWGFGLLTRVWQFLHEAIVIVHGNRLIAEIDYAVIPWTAIVMIGYGLAPIFVQPPKQRDRSLLTLGALLVLLFLVLRGLNIYGDPQPWSINANATRTLMSFFAISKFPPSLDYACATLGLAFAAAPLLMRLPKPAGELLRVLGATALFAYVLHFYLMHALALATLYVTRQDVSATFDQVGKMAVEPQAHAGVGFDLPAVYIAWIVVLAMLYPLCRWRLSKRPS